jgi:hypothetical protein
VILHEDGKVIASFQTCRAQDVSEFIHPRPQSHVGADLARRRHNDGWLIGVGFEAMAELNGGLPNVIHTCYVKGFSLCKALTGC